MANELVLIECPDRETLHWLLDMSMTVVEQSGHHILERMTHAEWVDKMLGEDVGTVYANPMRTDGRFRLDAWHMIRGLRTMGERY